MAKGAKISAEFTHFQDTAGTRKHSEDDSEQPPIIGTQYVKKWAAKKLGNPNRIRVTIEALD
jgi:hypothetical protein